MLKKFREMVIVTENYIKILALHLIVHTNTILSLFINKKIENRQANKQLLSEQWVVTQNFWK